MRSLFLATRKASWRWLDAGRLQLEDYDCVTAGERVWVDLRGGQRVGFAAVYEQSNFLHSLYVDPAWQHNGVGSALMNEVEARFTATGSLNCLLVNRAAQIFYQRRHWKMVSLGESTQGKYVLMYFKKGRQLY